MENRVIKFRLFNKSTKQFTFFVLDSKFDCYSGWLDNCALEQFTGLHDRDGKEIYEGDVVKCHDHPTGVEDCTGAVCFRYGYYFVDGSTTMLLHDYGAAWIEIIGHIHETN